MPHFVEEPLAVEKGSRKLVENENNAIITSKRTLEQIDPLSATLQGPSIAQVHARDSQIPDQG